MIISSFMEDGSGRVIIRRSKTDQAGEGAIAYLSPDTPRELREKATDTPIRSSHSLERERRRGQRHRWSPPDIGRCIHLRGSTHHRPSGMAAVITCASPALAPWPIARSGAFSSLGPPLDPCPTRNSGRYGVRLAQSMVTTEWKSNGFLLGSE